MPERIHVEYSRKFSTQTNGDFNTHSYGAGWDFDVADGANFQSEYERGLAVVVTIVDQIFEQEQLSHPIEPQREPNVQNNVFRQGPQTQPTFQPPQPVSIPGERFAREPVATGALPVNPTNNGAPVEGVDYEFKNARVWNVEPGRTQRGKQFIKVRIGSKEQIPGTGYATVKSYNPYMISKLSGLTEGDHVDIRGQYEGWDGNNGRMYDFVPQDVDRVRDVRAD